MICLSWNRPSSKDQASCLARCKVGAFNYDSKYVAATREAPFSEDHLENLNKDGYVINHAKVKLGSGRDTFVRGKQLLEKWGQFQLGWASVEASTPIKQGSQFCVCSRELAAWIINPLQILYVACKEYPPGSPSMGLPRNAQQQQATFAFGSGTLKGHLLAGEERFSVEWRDDDSVWYEILSFSKPVHFLSIVGYPIARHKQKLFAMQSTAAMVQAVARETLG